MAVLSGLSVDAAQWLSDKPPSQWCKAYFDTFVKSDMLLNNLCESFNAMIKDARGKLILSLLERIKSILMKRVQVNRTKMLSHKGGLCPKIEQIVEKTKQEASFCIPEWAGNSRFQVTGPGGQYVCDLESKCCACRRWELTGIPCKHGVAAIAFSGFNVEHFVHECYKTKNCVDLYSNFIEPTNGSHMWPEIDVPPLEPPIYVVQPGQSQHKRRLEEGEKRKKASRAESSNLQPPPPLTKKLDMKYRSLVRCAKCGNQGHNKRSCGKEKVKRVRIRKAAKRNQMEHIPSEVPVAPMSQSHETFFGSYHRHFGLNILGETVLQRQAHQSQPVGNAPTSCIISRGNKVLFSSQPK